MLCHRSAVISVLIPAPSSFLICVLWLRSLFFFPIATPAQMLLRNPRSERLQRFLDQLADLNVFAAIDRKH